VNLSQTPGGKHWKEEFRWGRNDWYPTSQKCWVLKEKKWQNFR
jgi:hypothetical protein